ncbi:MAG: hypothetical protein Q7R41_01210 [Phycisphaerales bacterium]|nr:hypothetical protein [Phycisphaerales bacterium]
MTDQIKIEVYRAGEPDEMLASWFGGFGAVPLIGHKLMINEDDLHAGFIVRAVVWDINIVTRAFNGVAASVQRCFVVVDPM